MDVPNCVAKVPDGNRRDESEQDRSGQSRDKVQIAKAGHARGLVNCRRMVQRSFDLGVKHVVVWGASESNLRNRHPQEIAFLYKLLKGELRYRSRENSTYGFRLCGLWNMATGDPELAGLVEEAERKTAGNTEQVLTLLFGYDGLTEMAYAARAAVAAGEAITPATLRKHCWTSHLPDVDLIIRTGTDIDPELPDPAFINGDIHRSDLLLPAQGRNAQECFSRVRWPSFTTEHLESAFEIFARRQRRCGA